MSKSNIKNAGFLTDMIKRGDVPVIPESPILRCAPEVSKPERKLCGGTLEHVVAHIKGRRDELLKWYDESIPLQGVSFGALEMQCERATTYSLLTELISHFSCVKMNGEKRNEATDD